MAKILLAPYRDYGLFVTSNEEGFLRMVDLPRAACVSRSCKRCLECKELARKARGRQRHPKPPRQPWEAKAA